MCWPYVAYAAAALIAAGAIKSEQAASKAGDAARKEGILKKKAADNAALGVKRDAFFRIQKIRSASIVMRGKQVAAQSSQGAIVGFGSTQAAVDHTMQLAAQDTLATIYSAQAKSNAYKAGGNVAKIDANARADSLKQQGVASLLSGLGSAASVAAK